MTRDWDLQVDDARWLPVPAVGARDPDTDQRWLRAAWLRLSAAGARTQPELSPLLESAPRDGGVVFFPAQGGPPVMATLRLCGGDEVARLVPRWTDRRGARLVRQEPFAHPTLGTALKVTRATRMASGTLMFSVCLIAWGDDGGIELSTVTPDLLVAAEFAEHGEILVAGIVPAPRGSRQPTNL